MNINWRYAVGVTTIVGVLGLTTYAIVLHRRQLKDEENSMTLDEAKDLVEKSRKSGSLSSEKIAIGLINDLGFEKGLEKDIVVKTVEEVEKILEKEELEQMEEDLRNEEPVLEPEPILLEDEGEGKLRYDPNSDEALVQYMRMEAAEWAPNDPMYDTLMALFDVIFEPINDGDTNLHSKLVDYRSEFFGPASRWAIRVSFADLLLHFARLADFNIGAGVKYWAEHFLDVNGINAQDMSEETLIDIVQLMNEHIFVSNNGFTNGLFAIESESMDRALEIAAGTIEGSLTYEIEFNEFLKVSNERI